MKTSTMFKRGLSLLMAFFLLACGTSNNYYQKGTATDRTGANGATNGNGKVPSGNAHKVNY